VRFTDRLGTKKERVNRLQLGDTLGGKNNENTMSVRPRKPGRMKPATGWRGEGADERKSGQTALLGAYSFGLEGMQVGAHRRPLVGKKQQSLGSVTREKAARIQPAEGGGSFKRSLSVGEKARERSEVRERGGGGRKDCFPLMRGISVGAKKDDGLEEKKEPWRRTDYGSKRIKQGVLLCGSQSAVKHVD